MKKSVLFPIVQDDSEGECICGAVGWADLPRENDPVSGIWKELLLVVIYKNLASLRMRSLGPLILIWPLNDFTHPSGKTSLYNLKKNHWPG